MKRPISRSDKNIARLAHWLFVVVALAIAFSSMDIGFWFYVVVVTIIGVSIFVDKYFTVTKYPVIKKRVVVESQESFSTKSLEWITRTTGGTHHNMTFRLDTGELMEFDVTSVDGYKGFADGDIVDIEYQGDEFLKITK